MFNFLSSVFSGLPSTSSYEARLLDQEKKYTVYMETFESDEYKRYVELKEYIYSPETRNFNPENLYGLSRQELKKAAKDFKQERSMQKKEFKRLKETKTMKTYFYLKKYYAKSFAEQERWVSKFYEDFSKPELDPRWTDRQAVGEQLLNGAYYSPIEDLHIYSSNNIQQNGGMLKIRVREEQKEGLAWDKKFGLVPKMFRYTSGMLSSSHAFRQMYGKFVAKIQVKQSPGTYHAFWMGTDSKRPHLNVFKIEDHNLSVAVYTGDTTIERKLKYTLKNDFYIYTLLWTKDKIVWFINGKKIFETTNVVNEPMYISFSSGVFDKKASSSMMYVDWIRCYRIS